MRTSTTASTSWVVLATACLLGTSSCVLPEHPIVIQTAPSTTDSEQPSVPEPAPEVEAAPRIPESPVATPDSGFPVPSYGDDDPANIFGTGTVVSDGGGDYVTVTLGSGSSLTSAAFLDISDDLTERFSMSDLLDGNQLAARFLVEAIIDSPTACLDSPDNRQWWADVWTSWLAPEAREEAVRSVLSDDDADGWLRLPPDRGHGCDYSTPTRYELFDAGLTEVYLNSNEDLTYRFTVWTQMPAQNPEDPIARPAYIEHQGEVLVVVAKADDQSLRVLDVLTKLGSDWHIRD